MLLLGLFPRAVTAGAGADAVAAADLHPKVKAVNERLAHIGDGKKVVYLDIGPRLLNAQGGLSREVMPDFVHLSPKGYATWADAIAGPVGELLK